MSDIKAIGDWNTNADLIADVAALGYIKSPVLDPTYGEGTFWKKWWPGELVYHDLKMDGVDFTRLPYETHLFPTVVFDPPYKLNGTPSQPDIRYGVDVLRTWQQRMELISRGVTECARVCSEHLLVKCQDQVSSGKVRWQTDWVTHHALLAGFGKVDAFLMPGGRAQPEGRSQAHARRNYSTLLVFKRAHNWQR